MNYNEIINKNTRHTDVLCDIGESLIKRYNYMLYQKLKKEYPTFSQFQEANNCQIIDIEDSTLNAKLGSILINWLLELKIVNRKVITTEILNKLKKTTILTLEDQILKLMPTDQMSIYTLPVKIPMISPPKKYLNNFFLGVMLILFTYK